MKKIAALAIVSLFAATSAFAQTPAPAAPATAAKPAAAASAKMSATDKQALSKKCSADADAKGLHGKERKKFRDACQAGKYYSRLKAIQPPRALQRGAFLFGAGRARLAGPREFPRP